MDGNYIIYLLRKKGSSGAAVAKQSKVTRATVHRTIFGKTRSLRIRTAICAAVGKPIEKVFPPVKTSKSKKNKQIKGKKQTDGTATIAV